MPDVATIVGVWEGYARADRLSAVARTQVGWNGVLGRFNGRLCAGLFFAAAGGREGAAADAAAPRNGRTKELGDRAGSDGPGVGQTESLGQHAADACVGSAH